MMKTSRTRLSIASLSAVASSRWMARRCEQSIWGLTTPRLRDHRQWLINRPEFPEFRRQNFRNPHLETPKVTFCVRGVVSPLLSNIVLDELDHELARRGHRFVRYADDANIYVRSERAGYRVMASV